MYTVPNQSLLSPENVLRCRRTSAAKNTLLSRVDARFECTHAKSTTCSYFNWADRTAALSSTLGRRAPHRHLSRSAGNALGLLFRSSYLPAAAQSICSTTTTPAAVPPERRRPCGARLTNTYLPAMFVERVPGIPTPSRAPSSRPFSTASDM
ncbi:hypothetical protein BD413DRAFT_181991 [Trametes elegans]|nr:hypothetical protein BD413DRAFT_181991 [Trametes elegans]